MSVLYLYLVWILPSPWCSETAIAYKGVKIVAIGEHNERLLGIFSLSMRRNGYLGAFTTEFTWNIQCFVLLRRMTFWPWECFNVQCFSCSTNRHVILRLSKSRVGIGIGSPRKPHETIFRPRIVDSIYNFYWATMTIKDSLYLGAPVFKQFLAAK